MVFLPLLTENLLKFSFAVNLTLFHSVFFPCANFLSFRNKINWSLTKAGYYY